jgi:hypothetical protein
MSMQITLREPGPDDMVWLVETVQEAVPEATLCLDSANQYAPGWNRKGETNPDA